MSAPRLSIVVVGYDMARELPRTVLSLAPPYQRKVAPGEVEILLMDNASPTPVRRDDFPADLDLRVIRVEDGGASPCRALNRGVELARSDNLAVVIDGARMASPGLADLSLSALGLGPDAFAATLGFHLGPKVQQVSVTEGYDRDVEDALLAGIGWPDDGYRLFEICALGESYSQGAFAAPPETTYFTMRRETWRAVGGYDERFADIGGGLASFDFFERAAARAGDAFVLLVGEGTFHQLHYGATTRAGGIRRTVEPGVTLAERYAREYERVVGRPYAPGAPQPRLYGRLTHPAARRFFFPPET